MRFMQMLGLWLLVGVLVSPALAAEHGHGKMDRAVAAEKGKAAKKQKKGKASAKAKKGKKAKAAKVAKKGKARVKAAKLAKPKKRAHVSHIPSEPHADTVADPAGNFEVSPEAQDDLPEPNTGNLTE